MNAMHIKKLA